MSQAKHILVVDDSDVIRRVAASLLARMGYRVSEAANGQEALEHCRAHMPDAVLLDWHLPVMGSIEFLEFMRADSNGDRPYVIYCTSEHDVEDITRALNSGANEYLMKPFDRAAIESKLVECGLR
ncbi:MAG: response regulator [Hyphomicrobiaceae bacterium]|nr:MAG: response regulator [Hyphomicrobiaceae bacterium]